MDGSLSNKPKNFVDDPEKLYRQRGREARTRKPKVDPKEETSSSSSKETSSPTLMANQEQERTIGELCIPDIGDLPIQALDDIDIPFEIKGYAINMVQNSPFSGKEDANLHLQAFIQLCRTFNMQGMTQDQIRARLFPFSLLGRALQWFHSLPKETVQSWNDLMKAFITEYYSPSKTQVLRNKIITFAQHPTESIAEAHERFHDYLRAVPHHKFPKEDLVQKFYQGLTAASRAIIDASAGGSLIDLTPTKAMALFKKVADNDAWASSGRLFPVQPTGNAKGVLQVEQKELLEGKIDSLMRRLEKMELNNKEARAIDLKAAEARSTCEDCGEFGHVQKDCPEEAKLLDYMKKGEWFPPPNFRYGQGRSQFNASSSIQNVVPLRIQLKEFMEEQGKINKDTVAKFKAMDKILENIDVKVTDVGSSNHQVLNMMKMLETQVTQLAGRLPGNDGRLPGQPQGPESAKAIQTRSGKETEDPERPAGARKPKASIEVEMSSKEKAPSPPIQITTEEPEFEDKDTKLPPGRPRTNKGRDIDNFERFVEVVRRLSINVPLLDALQVPTYSRYFKDILMNKREVPPSVVKLTEECSAAIANQAPEKKKDPGCPTIPCSIGALSFDKALCDLGASVSVMPRDVFEKLHLPEPEPTAICLELADNSVRYPLGIAEDVPVKIGEDLVPVDFVILEMGEGAKTPLILGRPFLKTARANIDVGKGEIKFHINGTMSAYKFRPRFEVCNMINSNYVPHYHHYIKEKLKKKEEPKKEENKIEEIVASVKTKESSLVKTKKKPSAPKIVKKWVPKIATPSPSVDLK